MRLFRWFFNILNFGYVFEEIISAFEKKLTEKKRLLSTKERKAAFLKKI